MLSRQSDSAALLAAAGKLRGIAVVAYGPIFTKSSALPTFSS